MVNENIDNEFWIDIKGNCKCYDNFIIKCKPNENIFEIFLKNAMDYRLYKFEEGKQYCIMDTIEFFISVLYYLDFEKNDSKIIEFVEREELHFNCYKQLAWYYIYDIYIYEFPHKAKEEGYPIEDLMLDYLYWSFGDPTEPDNYFYDKFESEEDKYYRCINESKIRKHQKKFREKLLEKHTKCQICGFGYKDLLVASHIKGYSKCSNYESKDPYNGFLLCRNHDALFDSGLITFDDKGNIIISDKLSFEDRVKSNITEDTKIDLEEGNLKYLKWNREVWFKR